MALIEKISCQGPGTHSVLAKDSWQVLKVNASHENDVDNLRSLYRNIDGGMAISLLVGRAVLIVQSEKGGLSSLQTIDMVRGTSYYVPENAAYHIVMEKGSELFGVRSPDGFQVEMDTRTLDQKEVERIKRKINKAFKH